MKPPMKRDAHHALGSSVPVTAADPTPPARRRLSVSAVSALAAPSALGGLANCALTAVATSSSLPRQQFPAHQAELSQ
jgi:hypothetical protein